MHTYQGSGKSLFASSCVLSLEGGVVSVIAGGAVTDVLQLDEDDRLKNDVSYVERSILNFFSLLVCPVSSSSYANYRMW